MTNPRAAALSQISISPKQTVLDALKAMTSAFDVGVPSGIALVTENGLLKGIACDGDVRRALIKGCQLSDPIDSVMQVNPITVHQSMTDKEKINHVLDESEKRGRRDFKVDRVVVVNDQNQPVDVLNFFDLWYTADVKNRRVCILGMGYVGLTFGLVLADSDFDVIGFDRNEEIISNLREGVPHFYENGLEGLLKFHKNRRIKFTSSKEEIAADTYVITVGTPVDPKTHKPVLDQIKEACLTVGEKLKRGDLVILRSTVSLGVSRQVAIPILDEASGLKCGSEYHLVFAPERTLEGKALEELRQLPQVVGGATRESTDLAARIFRNFTPSIVLLDSLEEAELVKLINNTFRDVSFGFSNQVAVLCEDWNLDAVKVIRAANEGYHRNKVPMPSPGVGGPCLKKDPYILMAGGEKASVDLDIVRSARNANEYMSEFVARKAFRFLDRAHDKNSKKEFKFFILGMAFKGVPETSDVRNSTALDLIEALQKGAQGRKFKIYAHDFVVSKQDIEKLGIHFVELKEGFSSADCAFIMNNHPSYAKMDLYALLSLMNQPGFFFDGWYTFPPSDISRVPGIVYEGLGGFSIHDKRDRL